MPRKLVAGNWKMNGLRQQLSELDALYKAKSDASVGILICTPATLIESAAALMAPGAVKIGGQDCHANIAGAHTGDVSAEMLADAGATAVIVGHSERREDHGESSDMVRAKAVAAHRAGLTAIICVGETLAQREAKNTLDIIGGQMAASLPDGCNRENTIVAYEPVWAIGTGKVASTKEIAQIHNFVRERLIRRFGEEDGAEISLLYGGSVKASNATDIFATDNVDGALVGGASLAADDFLPIIKALENTA
ncbi:MAG: triose-phosphate isomerase [Pseudomonadota bacterium]